MKLHYIHVPLQAVVSSLWQLAKQPVTGGGVPEESRATNRVSTELSHVNLAQGSLNGLRGEKIAKGLLWPTCLAAGIRIYATADPVPALEHWLGHNFQTICKVLWRALLSAYLHDRSAQLQIHSNWLLLVSTTVCTLSLSCELGLCFQKEVKTAGFEDLGKELQALVCLYAYLRHINKTGTENSVLGNHKINIFHILLTIVIPQMFFVHCTLMQKIHNRKNLEKHLIRSKVYNSSRSYHVVNLSFIFLYTLQQKKSIEGQSLHSAEKGWWNFFLSECLSEPFTLWESACMWCACVSMHIFFIYIYNCALIQRCIHKLSVIPEEALAQFPTWRQSE